MINVGILWNFPRVRLQVLFTFFFDGTFISFFIFLCPPAIPVYIYINIPRFENPVIKNPRLKKKKKQGDEK